MSEITQNTGSGMSLAHGSILSLPLPVSVTWDKSLPLHLSFLMYKMKFKGMSVRIALI